MRLRITVICLLLLASVAFAQGDRGTITGTIADPAGAVVAAAPLEARNTENGAVYQAASSATGNFTLSQLPTGTYELSVNVSGFKKYVRQNIALGVAQVLRLDIALEVGATTDSVTVTETAPMLKTESGELSHNVTSQSLDELPVLGIGSAGSASGEGIRNPLAVTQLIPGATFSGSGNLTRVNGAQGNTNAIRIEGQDATNGYLNGFSAQTQPSVDAIQEISIQTSNYSAEFGQVGGGLFNMTMKSGSNQFHGTAYDYFVNEIFNAGQPFTNDPNRPGNLIRAVQRRNDYGVTFGGPVWIPKLYNGHNRTFFFFNFEQYRETQVINNQFLTIPIQAYRDGDFSQAKPPNPRTLATDPLGRAIIEGTIYDPATQRLAPNGQTVRDPFPNNKIDPKNFDPVSAKIQSMIPAPTVTVALVNNGVYPFLSPRLTYIPAFKIDHSLSAKAKLSFYWSQISYDNPRSITGGQADGLPLPISATKSFKIVSQTDRLNFDYSLSPTLLLHMGAGFVDHRSDTLAALLDYNALTGIGLKGVPINRTFPKFTGMSGTRGGVSQLGPNDGAIGRAVLPTANTSLTWVKNNHTFKMGAEMRLEGFIGIIYTNTTGAFAFTADQTGLPSTNGQNLGGGTVGFNYASFMLGSVGTLSLSEPPDFRVGKQQWGFFGQDSWKITRKLTLDYGIRYDYSGYFREQYGRLPNFSSTLPNPTAGNLPGAVLFEGSGPGHCNCDLAHVYPYAFGPRLGVAYQVNPKTVVRAGFGIVYTGTGDASGVTGAFSISNPITNPAFGDPAMLLRDGITLPHDQYKFPNFDPGQFPKLSSLTSPPVFYDQNAGRPARQYQWSIGVQREIARNLAVEASYVANRGVWWNSPGLININAITPERLAAFGLNVNSATDRALLAARLDSATAAQRGFSKGPYAAFPLSSTVAQALRPFPQFGTLNTWWSPLGKTWYDSLQVKGTKRFSHGLQFASAFTWQKQLATGSPNVPNVGGTGGSVNDVFNRDQNKYLSQYDQPFLFNASVTYTVPKMNFNWGTAGKALSWGARDWTLGTFLSYGSGMPILAPASNNALATSLFRGTFANRVPDQPLFTADLNCHCFDPNTTFVLNPKAWVDPAAGQFSTSAAYYSDYRLQRRPQENFNVGRTFRIRERASFNIRMEFTNVFNRTQVGNPTSINAGAAQTKGANGLNNGGFGWINTSSVAFPPRSGTIVGRFTF